MALLRSLLFGLIGYALAPRVIYSHVVLAVPQVSAPSAGDANAVSIIDVARGVSPNEIPALLHLEPGDRLITPIDEVLASAAPGTFLDVSVRTWRGPVRRVLVLLH